MIKLIDILYEGKQVGILYHLMDENAFPYNLTNDRIGNRKSDIISFSRSKSFLSIPQHLPKDKVFARFIIDGDKLSNNYKIFPVDDRFYKSKNQKKDSFDWLFEDQEDEYEERVIGVINNIGKYIIKIEIFKEIDEKTKKLLKQYLKKYPHISIS
jgi:hypothetical protein